MTRTTLYGTLTHDEELNEDEKAMLYIKECAELVGLEVIEDETAFNINFIAKIMKRLRKEPKTGHWIIEVWNNKEHHTCSVCQKVVDYEPCYHYCPYCGARMESEDKE